MIEIRTAKTTDAARLLEIYDHYVRNTAITFEYDTPSPDEFTARIEHILKRYPYLVIEKDGRIEGYAYAGTFKARAAYDWSCEVTIYLDRNAVRCGMGRMLYEALEEELKKAGILNLYACIADPEQEDEYLTKNSAGFHAHLGYVKAGEFHQCGYKFGRWYNMIWMEKIIGEHGTPQPVRSEKKPVLSEAGLGDLQEILQLQYLAYQSEAALFGNRDIPPLKQTLDEVITEYHQGLILKLTDENNTIIGSVRARENNGTVYIGKLMVHPDYRRRGFGKKLLAEIENSYPGKRYELFTSTKSKDNIRLYQSTGYKEFDRKVIRDDLNFVYLEKDSLNS